MNVDTANQYGVLLTQHNYVQSCAIIAHVYTWEHLYTDRRGHCQHIHCDNPTDGYAVMDEEAKTLY